MKQNKQKQKKQKEHICLLYVKKKKKTQNETKRNEKIHLRKKAKRIEKISVLLLFASNKKKKGKWNIVLTSGNVLIFPSQNG